jgi:2-oxoglutarate ferredoxin oxidoreductase subunit beta
MSYIPKPKFHHPGVKRNSLGLTKRDYEGGVSTLCAGCGHDSVTSAIIQALWGLATPPYQVAKMSGIGCSSKTPGYFLNPAHGVNSVHGRMPSVTTGAYLANRKSIYLGVSGDGDSASIGIGQFVHAIRRRVNMLYIVENNGVYGLTKGQFSATADYGVKTKYGTVNENQPIDLAMLAVELGAGFVARAFSGDKDQLVPLIQAGLQYNGFAFIDVISPCVTFNNHKDSTKSYQYAREHEYELTQALYDPSRPEITAQYSSVGIANVDLPDGTTIALQKLDADYNPKDRIAASSYVKTKSRDGTIVTGLIYIDDVEKDLHQILGSHEKPLRDFTMKELCPGSRAMDVVNKEFV